MEQEVYSIVCGKQSNYKPELKKRALFWIWNLFG